MTFTEAAVEVLRLVGRPLHYKKITEIAIERNLLSHVGKSPEITMSSRLATMVKKDRGEAPILKVKPGIFGLREFSKEVLAMGELEEGDVDDILEAIDEESAEAEEVAVSAAVPTHAADPARRADGADTTERSEAAPPVAETASVPVEEKAPKSTHKLPGQEVYPEEDDDDVPILAKVDEPADSESEEARNKKRRRKKRPGRGGEGDERPGREARDTGREARDSGRDERPVREERADRPARDARDDRGGRDRHAARGGRDLPRTREGREAREVREPRDERGRDNRDREERSRDDRAPRREPEVRGDWQREPENGDLAGKDLADAIESTLAARGGRPQTFVEIADGLVQRGRLQGDPNALAPTIAAAVRGDIARRSATAQRPRFRIRFGEASLVDSASPHEITRAEQDAVRALGRHREMVHRALIRRLQELPNASLLEVIATWLNAVGVTSLRGVRRAGSVQGEFHLAGVLRRGPEETPIAIVLVRDGLVGRERVVDVRGSLHRYGDARQAWILGLGGLHGSAREEAAELAAAPVAVFDGMQLARSMEDSGVGVRRYALPLVMIDFDLFDELRGPGAPPRPVREPVRIERPVRAPEPDDSHEQDENEAAQDEADEPEDGEDGQAPVEGAEATAGGAEGTSKRRRRRRRRRRGGAEGTEGADGPANGTADSAPGDDDGDSDDAETGEAAEDAPHGRGREDTARDEAEDRDLDDERDRDLDDHRDRDLDDEDRLVAHRLDDSDSDSDSDDDRDHRPVRDDDVDLSRDDREADRDTDDLDADDADDDDEDDEDDDDLDDDDDDLDEREPDVEDSAEIDVDDLDRDDDR